MALVGFAFWLMSLTRQPALAFVVTGTGSRLERRGPPSGPWATAWVAPAPRQEQPAPEPPAKPGRPFSTDRLPGVVPPPTMARLHREASPRSEPAREDNGLPPFIKPPRMMRLYRDGGRRRD